MLLYLSIYLPIRLHDITLCLSFTYAPPVDYRSIFRPTSLEKFTVFDRLNRHVGLLRIFPSISAETVRAFLQPPMAGVVIQTYGAGNMPSNRTDIMEVRRCYWWSVKW